MNDIIQDLEVNATNGKENFRYISEKQLNAMKELYKREAKEIKQLQQENKQLKEKLDKYENPEDMTLLAMWCTEKVKEENQKLQTIANNCKQLKDNWNELKKYLHNVDVVVDYSENYDGHFINYDDLLDKIQELEQGSDSNE